MTTSNPSSVDRPLFRQLCLEYLTTEQDLPTTAINQVAELCDPDYPDSFKDFTAELQVRIIMHGLSHSMSSVPENLKNVEASQIAEIAHYCMQWRELLKNDAKMKELEEMGGLNVAEWALPHDVLSKLARKKKILNAEMISKIKSVMEGIKCQFEPTTLENMADSVRKGVDSRPEPEPQAEPQVEQEQPETTPPPVQAPEPAPQSTVTPAEKAMALLRHGVEHLRQQGQPMDALAHALFDITDDDDVFRRELGLSKPMKNPSHRKERKQKRIPWTQHEIDALIEECRKGSSISWASIHKSRVDFWNKNERNQVDLKDKFRILARNGQIPADLIKKYSANRKVEENEKETAPDSDSNKAGPSKAQKGTKKQKTRG